MKYSDLEMKHWSRRDFIFTLSGSVLLGGCASFPIPQEENLGDNLILMQSTAPNLSQVALRQGFIPANSPNKLFLYNLDHNLIQNTDIQIHFPHSAIFNKKTREIIAISKGSNECAIVSVNNLAQQKILKSPSGIVFYGHGTFIQKANEVLFTGYDINTLDGYILIYDSISYAHKGTLVSHGQAPHDLYYFEDEGVLCVANNGKAGLKPVGPQDSNFVWINYDSKKLLHKANELSATHQYQHFKALNSKKIIVALDAKDGTNLDSKGSLVIKLENYEMTSFKFSDWKELHGNILSVAIDDKFEIAITTTPESFPVIWDIKENNAVKALRECIHPQGVSYSTKTGCFYITTARDLIAVVDQNLNVKTYPSKMGINLSAHSQIVNLS